MTTEIGYIKFDGVDGSSEETKHKKWSAVYQITGGVTRPVASGSGRQTIEKATLSDFVVVKGFDASSPQLFQKSCQGEVFKKVQIEQVSNVGGQNADTVVKTTLENVYISNYSSSSQQSANGVLPIETLSLNYAKIEIEYTQVGVDGKVGGKSKGKWDIPAGKP